MREVCSRITSQNRISPLSCPAKAPTHIMKTKQTALLMGLVMIAMAATGAEENPAIKKDLAPLQGEWSMVSGSANGQTMPEGMRKQMKRVCKGDETTTT